MTRSECRRDFWIGVVTIVATLAYLGLIPFQVHPDTDGYDNISGRTLPYLVGGALLVLGAALAVTSHRKARRVLADGATGFSRDAARRVLVYVALITLYALGIAWIGYVVSTAAALAFAMWFSGARNRVAMVVVTLVTPPLLYWFFHVLMQIPLPEALLF